MFSKLKAVARVRGAADIRADLDALQAADKVRDAALADAAAARMSLVEAGDLDALEAHDAQVRRLNLEAEVSLVRAAALVRELAAAEHAADQVERRRKHAAGVKAAKRLRTLYHETYPEAARAVASVLQEIHNLTKVVVEANSALPDDAEGRPIDTGEPNRGREMIAGYETEVDQVYRIDTRSGREIFAWKPGDNPYIEERVRKITSWVPPVYSVSHVPISDAVKLPGLAWGDAPFWDKDPAR